MPDYSKMLHPEGPDVQGPVSVILQSVHNSLYQKYSQKLAANVNGNTATGDASLLQDFLQAWKSYKMTGNLNLSMFDSMTIQQIEALFGTISTKAAMFKTSSGTRFEQQFGNFIFHILDTVGKINTEGTTRTGVRKGIQTGTATAISALGSLVDDLVKQYMADIKDTTLSEIEREMAKTQLAALKKYIQAGARPGKTDITANRVQVVIEGPILSPTVAHIIDLLHRSQFTLKNYSSAYEAYLEQLRRGLDPTSVHFGNTTLYRSFLAVLSELGYDARIIKSIFYAAHNTTDASVEAHFYHIRFIYELTGMGQKYMNVIDAGIGEADFLIYNDPNSQYIYVRSTADLIIQMFNEVFEGDWKRGISISKSALSFGQQRF